ncbi:MAG: LCP family protein [Eubacteriales bacterium]|nr:LCP family protein [Eubacteriales bacterium]
MKHGRSSSHHRHHKHRGAGYWFRKHRKFAAACALIVVVFFGAAGAWVYHTQKLQESRNVTAGVNVDMGSGYRNITYNGKNYQYNSLITTVLYAGVDSQGEMTVNERYASAPRADSVSLIVLDKKHKKMTIIALNRDTMTEVRRYTMNGTDRGTYVTHLGYAYAYGDGGKVSCENLKEAVSELLGGIPINEYAVTNQSSMVYINDLAGGITLEVPNNDLADLYPEMTEGARVTLDDTNVADFLHYRDTEVDYSNEGRIERQQAYVTEYVAKMKEKLKEDANGIWDQIGDMENYLQTSITRNKYLKLVNLLDTVEFTDEDYYRPEGEDQLGEEHDEFYVDEEALREKIIELFYLEVA